ncbi:MAG TPA: DUF11 domain-containing protein, partial [Allosphingosinicella sp.]
MSPTRSPLPLLAMGRITPLPGAILLALLTALWLAVAAPALAAGAPGPRTISNIATIEWELAGGKISQQSNRVDIDVGPASIPASLAAYRFAPGSPSLPMPILSMAVAAPQCGAADSRALLAAAWQSRSLDPASLTAAAEIVSGEPLLFVVEDRARNVDGGRVETTDVAVRSASGDSQALTIFETAPDSGKFAGFIQTTEGPAGSAGDDCRLSVEPGDVVTIEGLGLDSRAAAAVATVTVLAPALPAARPKARLQLTKQASRAIAAPGEAVAFTVEVRNGDSTLATGDVRVTDKLPPALRLRPRTLRVDDESVVAEIAP